MTNIFPIFLTIVLWLSVGTATAYFAQQRGRDPLIWFMIGMLLGLMGLLLLFLLPPVAEEESSEEAEYKALEEKISAEPTPPAHECLIKDWYYYDKSRQRHGPVRFEMLKHLWHDGALHSDSYVWCEGMDKWTKIEENQSLHTHLQLL